MTPRVGLIGMPVSHSLSPLIHQALHPIPYHLYETLDIKSVLDDKRVIGLNVTAPLKEKAFELASFKDPFALKTGAVNTLIKRPDGLYGYNTDVLALIDIFKIHLTVSKETPITIVGNGATEKSVRCALEEIGYDHIQTVARHPKENQVSWHDSILAPQVLIQATPLGMTHLEDEFPIDRFDLSQTTFILDLIYAPLNTPLLQAAKKNNIPFLNGLPMLIAQATHAAMLFTGHTIDNAVSLALEKKLIQATENIVIIGMPYSGKTTLGKALSVSLKKPFIDIDALIEKEVNMSIPDYIDRYEEIRFRAVENKVISSLKDKTNMVIATGGGSILDSSNVEALKLNGCFLYLDSPTPKTFDHTRPLTSDLKMYLARKKERQPLYESISDITLKGYQATHEYIKEFKIKYEAYLNTKWP